MKELLNDIKRSIRKWKALLIIFAILICLIEYVSFNIFTSNTDVLIFMFVGAPIVNCLFGFIISSMSLRTIKKNEIELSNKVTLSDNEIRQARQSLTDFIKEKSNGKISSLPEGNYRIKELLEDADINIHLIDWEHYIRNYLQNNYDMENRRKIAKECDGVLYKNSVSSIDTVCFVFAVIGLISFVIVANIGKFNWLTSITFLILGLAAFLWVGFKCGFSKLDMERISNNSCPYCYALGTIVDSEYSTGKEEKLNKEYEYKDHYGTVGEVYADGKKVGTVQGYTGSTVTRERQNIKKYYHNTRYCKCCLYRSDRETSRVETGDWTRV